MWTTRQFRSKGKQREEPSYGTYAARRGNPLVGQVSVCQVLVRQRGYTPRIYFELYCTAYLRDPCGPRRIDERRERRVIGNAPSRWSAHRFPREKRTKVRELPPKRRSETSAAIVRGPSATLSAVADEVDKRELAVAQGSLSTAQEIAAVLDITQYAAATTRVHRLL